MYLPLSLQNFLLDAKPSVSQATSMIKELDDDLKDLYIYYGEDPSLTKSEDFFGMLHNFATIFTVSTMLRFVNQHSQDEGAKERYLISIAIPESTQRGPGG